jgi:hypothetical protein
LHRDAPPPEQWSGEAAEGAPRPRDFDLLLQLHPAWAGGYLLRGRGFLALARQARAEGAAEEEAGREPALFLREAARLARAAGRDAREALNLTPRNFDALLLMGDACRMMAGAEPSPDHRTQHWAAQALSWYERACELDPRLRRSMARQLEELRQEELQERERRLRRQWEDLPVAEASLSGFRFPGRGVDDGWRG